MLHYCHDYQEEYLYQEYFKTIASLGQFGDPNNWQEALDCFSLFAFRVCYNFFKTEPRRSVEDCPRGQDFS